MVVRCKSCCQRALCQGQRRFELHLLYSGSEIILGQEEPDHLGRENRDLLGRVRKGSCVEGRGVVWG